MADINRELNLVVNVQGGESVQNLKTQIREAKREVEQFEEGSEGFVRASQNVARLSDKLDDVNDQVKLLKGDALERVAGGFKGIGGAILDLDVGKLAMANQSLKSIPFKDLISNAKGFGKELFTLATNPLFLIPAAIGLIIANFDKLLKIFPGLGAIVDGVKAIFDQLVDAVLGLINYAGELYEEFRPIIDVLFPLIGIIGMITDLIAEQANTAEASSKRKVEAEKKYKESIDESNKSLGESRRRILVATGKLSEDEAERQRLKEDFITDYLLISEERRLAILEETSVEAKAVAAKAGDDRLKALQQTYIADVVELNKNIKDKGDAQKKADGEKAKADADKAEKEKKEKEKLRLDALAKEASDALDDEQRKKAAGEKFIADMKVEDERVLNEMSKMADDELNLLQESNDRKAAAEKSYTDMIKAENEKRLASEQQLQDLKVQAVQAGLSLISDLTSVFSGKSLAAQRRAFKIQKALSIAQVTIDTFFGAQKAFNSQFIPGVPDPTSPVRGAIAAGVAIAAGLGRVAKIAATKFEGSGGDSGGGAGGSGGGSGGGGGQSAPQGPIAPPIFNLGGQQIGGASNMLGNQNTGGGQAPLQVFVTETDIANVSNKVKVIEGNSLFGGGGG